MYFYKYSRNIQNVYTLINSMKINSLEYKCRIRTTRNKWKPLQQVHFHSHLLEIIIHQYLNSLPTILFCYGIGFHTPYKILALNYNSLVISLFFLDILIQSDQVSSPNNLGQVSFAYIPLEEILI